MKTLLNLLLLALVAVALFGVLALVGCAHLPPSPQTIPICLSEDPGVYAGSCGDKVTDEGYSCVLCDFELGCASVGMDYCVGADGCGDPRCHPRKAIAKPVSAVTETCCVDSSTMSGTMIDLGSCRSASSLVTCP